MNLSEKLIKIIDSRIDKKLLQSNFVMKYNGKVVKVIDNNLVVAQILGYDTNFTFINKSGETINEGDLVKIETTNRGLSDGFISECFHNINGQ